MILARKILSYSREGLKVSSERFGCPPYRSLVR